MGTPLTGVQITLPDGGLKDADINGSAGIQTSKLETRTSQSFDIPLTGCYTWDAAQTRLPGTAAADDLAFITGTWGTDTITLQGVDGKATTVASYAGFDLRVPHNYVAGQSIAIRVRAGMITTVSDGTATTDLQVYKADLDGAVDGSDLVQTAAVSINSLTKTDADFTLDGSSISPGDKLYCRVAINITDTATGTAVIGEISDMRLICSTRG